MSRKVYLGFIAFEKLEVARNTIPNANLYKAQQAQEKSCCSMMRGSIDTLLEERLNVQTDCMAG